MAPFHPEHPKTRQATALLAAILLATSIAACGGNQDDGPAPTTVIVSPASAGLLSLEATVQLTAIVHDQNGQVMSDVAVVWTSSDSVVAAVSPSGLATAMANGTVTVRATVGRVSGSATLAIDQVPANVTVTPDAVNLAAFDQTERMTAIVLDANGHKIEEADEQWETSDTAVASVDASGLVTALGNGSTTVTATAGTRSASVTVRVDQVAVTAEMERRRNWLRPSHEGVTSIPMALGDTLRMRAEAFDSSGHPIADAALKWTSDNPEVVALADSGLVRARSSGVAMITARLDSAVDSANITVSLCTPPTSVSDLRLDSVLQHIGLNYAGRTTVRRRDRSDSLRIDQVVDTVAWKNVENANGTIVVAAYYDATAGNSAAPAVWPKKAAIHAAGRIIHCDPPPTKNVVVIFTEIQKWETLRMSASEHSVIHGGADTYSSYLDPERLPLPFLPLGSPTRPEVRVGLLADAQVAYPAPGSTGPWLAVTPDQVEDITPSAAAIRTVGVIRPRVGEAERLGIKHLSSTASALVQAAATSDYQDVRDPVIRPDVVDRRVHSLGIDAFEDQIQTIAPLRWCRALARRLFGLEVDSCIQSIVEPLRRYRRDTSWFLSNALALLVPYFAVRYMLVGPRTRRDQAAAAIQRIDKWKKMNKKHAPRREKWRERRDKRASALRSKAEPGNGRFRTAIAWSVHCLGWLGGSLVLAYYLRWKWYCDANIKAEPPGDREAMTERLEQHQSDLEKVQGLAANIGGGLKDAAKSVVVRSTTPFAFGILSVAVATAAALRREMIRQEGSQMPPLAEYGLAAVAAIWVTYVVARVVDDWRAQRLLKRGIGRGAGHGQADGKPPLQETQFGTAFAWGVVGAVLLGLTTIEFTSVGGGAVGNAIDSQRVNLLILGAGVLIAVRESSSASRIGQRELEAEMGIIRRTTRRWVVWVGRRLEGEWGRRWRGSLLALAYLCLLLTLSIAGYFDIHGNDASVPGPLPPHVVPIYAVTITAMLMPVVLLWRTIWKREREESGSAVPARQKEAQG